MRRCVSMSVCVCVYRLKKWEHVCVPNHCTMNTTPQKHYIPKRTRMLEARRHSALACVHECCGVDARCHFLSARRRAVAYTLLACDSTRMPLPD